MCPGCSLEVRTKDSLGLGGRVAHTGRQHSVAQCDTLLQTHLKCTRRHRQGLLLQVGQEFVLRFDQGGKLLGPCLGLHIRGRQHLEGEHLGLENPFVVQSALFNLAQLIEFDRDKRDARLVSGGLRSVLIELIHLTIDTFALQMGFLRDNMQCPLEDGLAS